jgi:2-oxoglutarate dehydrogenase E1 component
MTPKSLLRLPAAGSSLDELTTGGFHPLIDDAEMNEPDSVKRIVLCSGKVFYELADARRKASGSEMGAAHNHVAVVRLEQFYPFPLTALKEALARYKNAKELVWCQEEPRNMGGWSFMESRLESLLSQCERPRYVGRAESPSPATGSYAVHVKEQERLVNEALAV